MTVRRLYPVQPESFAFTSDNAAWAERQVAKYPAGRQASAVIPILWRAQEQEGWVTEPAIRFVADMLAMPYIRVLEVATFYTQFQLAPVGRKAHVQVCGTTPCMLRGAGEILGVCRSRIAPHAHELSADGEFSWEEVECLGACVNAPMVLIGSDTYEDLTDESFNAVLDAFARGETPAPGPQNGRQLSAPAGGDTTLTGPGIRGVTDGNAVPATEAPRRAAAEAVRQEGMVAAKGKTRLKADAAVGKDVPPSPASTPDDLQQIKGIGPAIENRLRAAGITTFAQIAAWTEADVARFSEELRFPGRIEREDWINQARTLAQGKGE